MSRVYSDTVLPEDSGVSQDLTLGTTGDTVQVTSGATLKVNTLKDAGGNTIWTSNGSGVLSSINSAFSGAPTLLTTNTVSDGASSAFTSLIDSTYKVYIFKFYDVSPATDSVYFQFNVSADGGNNYNIDKTTTYFLARHQENDSQASLAYQSAEDLDRSVAAQRLAFSLANYADGGLAGELYIFNPSNTVFVKHFHSTFNYMFSNASPHTMNVFIGGYFDTTSAINTVSFAMSSGAFDGVIKMYGL